MCSLNGVGPKWLFGPLFSQILDRTVGLVAWGNIAQWVPDWKWSRCGCTGPGLDFGCFCRVNFDSYSNGIQRLMLIPVWVWCKITTVRIVSGVHPKMGVPPKQLVKSWWFRYKIAIFCFKKHIFCPSGAILQVVGLTACPKGLLGIALDPWPSSTVSVGQEFDLQNDENVADKNRKL